MQKHVKGQIKMSDQPKVAPSQKKSLQFLYLFYVLNEVRISDVIDFCRLSNSTFDTIKKQHMGLGFDIKRIKHTGTSYFCYIIPDWGNYSTEWLKESIERIDPEFCDRVKTEALVRKVSSPNNKHMTHA